MEAAYLVLDLETGGHALICQVRDREDNRTHLAHGMAREFGLPRGKQRGKAIVYAVVSA